jgi:hypothetical protein
MYPATLKFGRLGTLTGGLRRAACLCSLGLLLRR